MYEVVLDALPYYEVVRSRGLVVSGANDVLRVHLERRAAGEGVIASGAGGIAAMRYSRVAADGVRRDVERALCRKDLPAAPTNVKRANDRREGRCELPEALGAAAR